MISTLMEQAYYSSLENRNKYLVRFTLKTGLRYGQGKEVSPDSFEKKRNKF